MYPYPNISTLSKFCKEIGLQKYIFFVRELAIFIDYIDFISIFVAISIDILFKMEYTRLLNKNKLEHKTSTLTTIYHIYPPAGGERVAG